MNATQPAPLLSAPLRAAGALAAVAIIAATVGFAGRASETAVHSAQASLNPAVRYVLLPTVDIVAKRRAADDVTDVACAAPHTKI